MPTDRPTDAEITTVARLFARGLRDAMTGAEWREMRARNRAETNPHVCHAHDFVDANMYMHDAIRQAYRAPDGWDAGEDIGEAWLAAHYAINLYDVWNAAYAVAAARYLR